MSYTLLLLFILSLLQILSSGSFPNLPICYKGAGLATGWWGKMKYLKKKVKVFNMKVAATQNARESILKPVGMSR